MNLKKYDLRPWVNLGWLIVSQLVFLVLMVVLSKGFPSLRGFFNTNSGLVLFAGLDGLTVLAFIVWVKKVSTKTQLLLEFSLFKIEIDELAQPICIGAAFYLVIYIIQHITHGAGVNKFTDSLKDMEGGVGWHYWIVVMLGPIGEELVLRGFLYKSFRLSYSVKSAVLIISLISLPLHISVITASFAGFIAIFGLNALLCCCFERFRNVSFCIVVHMVYNGLCAFQTTRNSWGVHL